MEKFLAFIFLITLAVMLAASRFDFVWAGGRGFIQPLSAILEISDGNNKITRVETERLAKINTEIKRGEKITTGDSARLLIRIGQKITIALDQRTEIVLEKLSPSEVEIKILYGRLLAATSWETDNLIISTPFSQSAIKDGAITTVRYDFLDKTSILPLNTTAKITVKNNFLETKNAVNIQETAPFTISPADFNLTATEVSDFYQWAKY